MSEHDNEVPLSRKEKVGTWLCAIGWMVIFFGCFASNSTASILLMVTGAVSFIIGWRLAPGLLSSDEPEEAPKRQKCEPAEPVQGPEDDPVFMAELTARLRQHPGNFN